MAHIHPSHNNGQMHQFVCDGCGQVAGQDYYEGEAREMAHKVAKAQGWKVSHPGWGFRCPADRMEAS